MLRKITVWTVAVLLLFSFPVSALVIDQNAASASVISAYYLNDKVYMAVQLNEESSLEALEFKLHLFSDTYDVSEQTDSADATKYVLLVDLSTSMPHYQKFILSFADALLSVETEGITVTVAGFGERFEILSEDITGKEELRSELSALNYDHKATDICGGMVEAINYFSSGEHRDDGEMVHLILLTDGIPYLTGDPENEAAAIESSAEAAAEIVSTTSEVIVHTVCFRDDREEVTYSAVSSGKGLNLTAENSRKASEAGVAIGQFASSLYEMVFSVDWEFGKVRTDAQLLVSDDGSLAFVPVENLRNISTPLAAEVNRPTFIKPETEDTNPEQTDVPSDEPGTDGSSEEGDSSEEKDSSEEETPSEEDSQEVVPDPEQVLDSPSPVPADPESELPVQVIIVLAVCAGMLLMALIVVLIFLLVRIRSRSEARRMPESGVVRMKLQVVSGRCKEDGRIFALRDQLLIGSAKSCDIVFSDSSVLGKSTRVFLKEQTVYIEDLNECSNTSLGGMKIYATNRLRSGDEIQIGNVCFRFLF